MFCKTCGNTLTEGQNFCTKCGTAVETVNPVAYAPPAPDSYAPPAPPVEPVYAPPVEPIAEPVAPPVLVEPVAAEPAPTPYAPPAPQPAPAPQTPPAGGFYFGGAQPAAAPVPTPAPQPAPAPVSTPPAPPTPTAYTPPASAQYAQPQQPPQYTQPQQYAQPQYAAYDQQPYYGAPQTAVKKSKKWIPITIIALVVVAGLVFAAMMLFGGDDEAQIRSLCSKMETAIEKMDGDALVKLFAPGSFDEDDAEDMISSLMGLGNLGGLLNNLKLDVKIEVKSIEFNDTGDEALATATMNIAVEAMGQKQTQNLGTQDIPCVKVNGKWYFANY